MALEDYTTLSLILKIFTSFSIITSIIDVFLYWFFPQNRNFSFTNIIILSIINFIYSVSTLLPVDLSLKQPENTTMCQIQSFIANCSHCAQYLQVSIMIYCVFIKLIAHNHLEKNGGIYRLLFTLLLISFPLAFSIYIIMTKSHGNGGVFCWIDIYTIYKRAHIKKVIVNYYIIIWFLLFINLFFVVKIKVMMKKNRIKNEIYDHLILYPIILIFCSIPGTFNVIYRLLNNNKEIEFMIFMKVIFESCFGTAINIYFIASPWIKQSILDIIKNRNIDDDNSNLMPILDNNRNSFGEEK